MKGNIKKLGMFVIIAGIAVFIAVAMASADDHKGKKAIHGEYAFTGTGSCLISITGFNASLQPNDALWLMGPVALDDGVCTFNKDGTGSVRNIFRTVEFYSPAMNAPPDAGAANESWDFTYTVTDGGKITLTYVKGSYELDMTSGPMVPPSPMSIQYFDVPSWNGVLSPDGKIFYVSVGGPSIFINTSDKKNNNPTGMEAICNIIIQGFRISP
jgi:hypothetical protein